MKKKRNAAEEIKNKILKIEVVIKKRKINIILKDKKRIRTKEEAACRRILALQENVETNFLFSSSCSNKY